MFYAILCENLFSLKSIKSIHKDCKDEQSKGVLKMTNVKSEKTSIKPVENKESFGKKTWKKDRPRIVNIPLSQEEYDLINNAAIFSGQSKRDVVRTLITKNFSGFEYWAKNQNLCVEMFNELRKQGTDLNRIAKVFDSGEKTKLSKEDKEILDCLDDNLMKLAEFFVNVLKIKG